MHERAQVLNQFVCRRSKQVKDQITNGVYSNNQYAQHELLDDHKMVVNL